MPRESKKIKQIYERDREAFRVLWNCQHVPRSMLSFLSNERLRTYERQGLIERCRDTDNNEIIRCTAKGRKFISKLPEFVDRKPYISHTAAEHNCRLAEIYLSLTPEQQQNWMTERELSDLYYSRMDELRTHDYDRWRELIDKPWSPSDGGIVSEDGQVEILFEVITYNYQDLSMKETYSQTIGAPISYHRA